METWDNLVTWIEKKRSELDDDFIQVRLREENKVVNLRSEAARLVDEYSRKVWDNTNLQVDKIRADYQNEYHEKKDALENLIELKIAEFNSRQSRLEVTPSDSAAPLPASGEPDHAPSVVHSSKSSSGQPRVALAANPNLAQVAKELSAVLETAGARRVASSGQSELCLANCTVNQKRVVRCSASHLIYRASLRVKAKTEESILCRVVSLAQLCPLVRHSLLSEGLSIARYLCHNEGRKQARHPIFIKIYEILATDQKVSFFMREYSALNLEERFQAQHSETLPDWNESQLLNWSRQLCDGLLFLHSLCIAHLNVRASSIVFDKKDNIKLVGLSLASAYFDFESGQPRLLARLSPSRTVAHLPAECTSGPFDAWLADIWCAGMVVRQLLQRVKTLCPNGSPLVNVVLNWNTTMSTISGRLVSRSLEKSSKRVSQQATKNSIGSNHYPVSKSKTVSQSKLWADVENLVDRCVNQDPSTRLKAGEVATHPVMTDY